MYDDVQRRGSLSDALSIWRKIPTTNKRRVRVRRIFKGNGTTNERSARVRRVWRTTNKRSVRVRRKCPRTTNKRTPEHSHRTSPCGTAAQELVLLYFPSGLFVYSWISRRFVFSVTSVRPILFSRHAINRPLQTTKYEKEKCTSATPRHSIAHSQRTRDEGHERTRTGKTRREQPRTWTGAVVIATRSEGEGSWNAIKAVDTARPPRVIAG